MLFAEFTPGLVIEAGPITVTEQEIVDFARAFDPQWFHVDPEASAQGLHGRPRPRACMAVSSPAAGTPAALR
jgi:acyl dehydratase